MRRNERRGDGSKIRITGRCLTLQSTALLTLLLLATALTPVYAVTPAVSETLIFVSLIEFSGNTRLSDAALQELVQDVVGHSLTLDQLEAVAGRITAAYRDAGYVGSHAYLPVQRIEDGVVHIAILEARYGYIRIDNQSRLREDVLRAHLAELQPGEPVTSGLLEKRMATLSALAGVRARSALTPGNETGTSDLIVTVSDRPRLTGQTSLSNSGSRLTGDVRAVLTANVNNATGFGDRLSGTVTTGGTGFNHGRLGYEFPWGTQPLRLGIAYSAVQYKLGAEFLTLNAHGLTQQVDATLGAPLRRDEKQRFDWELSAHYKHIADHLSGAEKEKQILGFKMSVQGDHTSTLSTGRMFKSTYAIGITVGRLNIQSIADLQVDQATIKTNGVFHKLTGESTLVATVERRTELVGSVRAQIAFKNLDLTEKFTLGGPSGVRAYPSGEASGDEGFLASLELRRMHYVSAAHRLQGVLFADLGQVRLNKSPHDLTAQNKRTLYGMGIGLIWSVGDFSASSHYGWRLRSEPATAETDRGGRFWLHTTYRF